MNYALGANGNIVLHFADKQVIRFPMTFHVPTATRKWSFPYNKNAHAMAYAISEMPVTKGVTGIIIHVWYVVDKTGC